MGGLRRIAPVAVASLLQMAPQRRAPASPGDPAENLVRTRAFLTTTAAALDLTIDAASLANAVFTIRGGSPSLRTVIERNTTHLTGNTQGSTVDLEIRYGDLYLRLTRTWVDTFLRDRAVPRR